MRYFTWSFLVLGTILCAAMGIVVYRDGGEEPSLDMIDMSQIQLTLTPLSGTDVRIGEDVLFEVTMRNNGEEGVEMDLWFTIDLASFDMEKQVTTPYLSKESPLSGHLPNQSSATIRLLARPLENWQRGPYTFYAKVGIYKLNWARAIDSVRGHIIAPIGPEDNESRAGGSGDWLITSIWAANDAGKSFLAGAGDRASAPRTVSMAQNYPNPFNPATSISYEVRPVDGFSSPIRLDVYDIRGRLVRTLADEIMPAGLFTIEWDGRDNVGNPVNSGIYFFKLYSNRDVVIRRGILAK